MYFFIYVLYMYMYSGAHEIIKLCIDGAGPSPHVNSQFICCVYVCTCIHVHDLMTFDLHTNRNNMTVAH